MFSTLSLAACGHAVAAPAEVPSALAQVVLDEGTDVPEPNLRDAMEATVGIADMGPAVVVQSWTWHPRGVDKYVVWVTCRGEGDARMCVVAAAPIKSGFVNVQASAAIGNSPARSVAADAENLCVFGDDTKGAWMQSLSFDGRASIAIGERTYEHELSP